MKRLDWKYLPIGALLLLSTALAPVFRAQDGTTVTRISAYPPDAFYQVDGGTYGSASSTVWAPNSKHVLLAVSPQNPPGKPKALYVWDHWEFGNNVININPAPVTADPSIPEYRAVFNVFYAITFVFFDCPDPAHCSSPGNIQINHGASINSSQDVYFPSGTDVILQAFPNPGWVFVGWKQATNQTVQGLQDTVHMSGPIEVYPIFQPARKINLVTDPPGLQVLADRATVYTPISLDWGMNTTHSIGPISPQQDRFGKFWSFKSWSDGGAVNHAYLVGGSSNADTLTATYVPAAGVTLLTQPLGLPLKVDGAMTTVTPLNPYFFTWGVGEKHHIEAPAQQSDAKGNVWKFSSWSNGGAASQDIVVPPDADTGGGVRLTAAYTQLARLTVTSPVATLTAKVDGLDCALPCDVLRDIGAKVQVSVPASIALSDSSRLDFNGWPGGAASYTVNMAADPQTVTASYHQMNRFTAASDPAAGAVWQVNPPSGDSFYGTNAMVSVSVSAQPGYRFRRWDGDLSGTIPSGVVAMSAPRNVRALLDPIAYIPPAGISNAAGSTPSTSVAPGSIVSIFGANLANAPASAGDGILPQALGGVTTRVADRLLPLVFASPGQINAILPDDLAPGQQILTVSPPGQSDVRAVFTVARNAPGLFGTVFHEDGSAVTSDSPVRAGELLTVYGTGFGPADHVRLEGFPIPASPDYLIVDGVDLRVGDTAATVRKAFAAPGKIGIDAVQFRLADGTTSGQLKVVVNGVESNTVTIAVQ